MSAYLEDSVGPQDGKTSVFILVPKKDNVKEKVSTITLISHASRVMFTNLQAKLQQYMN